VLVADELGPLPETIRSRCQLVPFRRLSRGAVEAWLARGRPSSRRSELRLLARVAGGRLDRAARLLDDDARARRAALLDAARATYRDEVFDPTAAAAIVVDAGQARGAAARDRESAGCRGAGAAGPRGRAARAARGLRRGARRAPRGPRRPRRLVPGPRRRRRGAATAVANADRLDELTEDAPLAGDGAAEAAEAARETWRIAEEFNVSAPLALEALFVRLRRAFSRAAVPAER
jgi:hypothetical protein